MPAPLGIALFLGVVVVGVGVLFYTMAAGKQPLEYCSGNSNSNDYTYERPQSKADTHPQFGKKTEEEICTICQEAIKQRSVMLRCKHRFHVNCLSEYESKCSGQPCPNCREKMH